MILQIAITATMIPQYCKSNCNGAMSHARQLQSRLLWVVKAIMMDLWVAQDAVVKYDASWGATARQSWPLQQQEPRTSTAMLCANPIQVQQKCGNQPILTFRFKRKVDSALYIYFPSWKKWCCGPIQQTTDYFCCVQLWMPWVLYKLETSFKITNLLGEFDE